MDLKCFIALVVAVTFPGFIVCLECFSCSDVTDLNNCVNIAQCSQGQSCSLEMNVSGQTTSYTLGCKNNQNCGSSPNIHAGIIGRDISARQLHTCHECCSIDNCNKHLCEHPKPSACIDDAKADCAWLNTVFNICMDIHHAKAECPKFCGLCTLVDGNWAPWSDWSTCDVTCDNGTRTRTRTCTDPAPADGGLDCIGKMTEINICSKQLCPVHGGWTRWSNWESCSVTCDSGIQKRHRNCSNPVPDRYGDHCFGDTMDARLCMPGPCANGGWSDWGVWATCSVTCGTGVLSRSRTCSNPRPSSTGSLCDGNSIQVTSCSLPPCRTQMIAFSSKDVVATSYMANQTVIFPTILFNEGNGYNNTTGIFTAPVPGTYSFTLQLSVNYDQSFYFAILCGNKYLTRGYVRDPDDIKSYTFTAIAVLKKGDRVRVESDVRGNGNKLYNSAPFLNFFSGALVQF
ncbi:hemicentin-1-like [Ruditapes philippinarum]|uniref:hemicentin-1-like n=1 Tax=Ruditapes philippinarum TaxID=129788 RepID=UPI00295BD858|nr:hemicentin-1-like [Ruditapes philippinarum]